MRAEPPAVSRKETWRGLPSAVFPSQEPVRALSWLKDFWASDWARAAVAARATKSTAATRVDLVMTFFLSPERVNWNHGLGLREPCICSRSYSASTKDLRLLRFATQKTRYCSIQESTARSGSGLSS